MLRLCLGALALSAMCQSLNAQTRAEPRPFSILEPSRYALVLTVDRRPPLTPEVASHLGQVVDSMTIILRVDSVRADSVFGIYGGEPRRIGAMIGGAQRPRRFAGRQAGRSFTIELSPEATDVGLLLSGRATTELQGEGTWQTELSSLSGRFRLSRIRPN